MKIFSQQNPQWAGVPLGSKGQIHMKDSGCTTTALAELNNAFGANCTPDQVAAHTDWYTPTGLILWTNLALQHAQFEPMGRVYGFNQPKIVDSLTSIGKGCLIQVAIPKAGNHWLKGEAVGYNNAIYARDPWTGTIVDVIAKYGAITGSAHFTQK